MTCPQFGSITCTLEPCRFDGTVLLVFNGQIVSLGSNPSVDLQWSVDAGIASPVFTVNSPGTVWHTYPVPGDGQTHAVQLNVINPTGCPPLGMSVAVPDCGPSCGPIQFSDTLGQCNPDGTRN